ncbi:MAG: hypothetical protein FRX49_09140 [Trebouxia sp. A1-2]|nr:MAG: hypothetical protein FRX49_09140 [Trebouxia sp. A1-2]
MDSSVKCRDKQHTRTATASDQTLPGMRLTRQLTWTFEDEQDGQFEDLSSYACSGRLVSFALDRQLS